MLKLSLFYFILIEIKTDTEDEWCNIF